MNNIRYTIHPVLFLCGCVSVLTSSNNYTINMHIFSVFILQPDPRVCHESLMDQIKRGATLKRNKSINDRSAPKIY